MAWRDRNAALYADCSPRRFLPAHLCCTQALGVGSLTCLALLSILVCFPLAYSIFAAGFGIAKLPAMSLVSIFLVLGIGVDAILVLCTSYVRVVASMAEASHPAPPDEMPADAMEANHDALDSEKQQALMLANAIKHAFPITTIATATTAVTFVAGLASPLVSGESPNTTTHRPVPLPPIAFSRPLTHPLWLVATAFAGHDPPVLTLSAHSGHRQFCPHHDRLHPLFSR